MVFDSRTELTKDERPITSITQFTWENDEGYAVGQGGVTKIEAYCEHGDMSMLPWIAVSTKFGVIARIPAQSVSGIYYSESENPNE